MMFLLLAGCNKEVANEKNNSVPIVPAEKFSCSIFEKEDGVYINNSEGSDIKKTTVAYTVSWIDTVDAGLHEKEFEASKEYEVTILKGDTVKIDSLSICLPPEKKTKSNLFKCNAKVISPCNAEHLFAIAYQYNKTNEKETFSNPDMSEYIEMYNSLKAEFG